MFINRSVVSDFRQLGPAFLGELAKAREATIQLNDSSGQPIRAMTISTIGGELMLDHLNRANWSCG